MNNMILRGLILLTYKGKALLMHKKKNVLDEEEHPWSLIGGIKGELDSFEKALYIRVHKETGIKISSIECISELCYHARLTDENVNNIQRSENQSLDFFSLKDINKLLLSKDTSSFIAKHGSLIPGQG